jgi:hypothetical protein
MGLTLRDPGLDGCNRAGGVALGPRPDRNEPCACGSGSKYKRCCLERDESVHRQWRGAALPAWMDTSGSKLRQSEVSDSPRPSRSFRPARRSPGFTATWTWMRNGDLDPDWS